MKQVLQDIGNGETFVETVPMPRVGAGQVLIQSRCSLVSAGTERMLVEFGKSNWLNKARQQPDKVRMVLDKVKTDGLLPTLDAVRSKLNQPLPMGYSNVGVVLEVGSGVNEFCVGDRVVSNGHHAEFVVVSKHLCAKIPPSVSDESAAFTVVGAIGLQGLRLIQPTLGETIVVTGLGLIGLLTIQLLRANGCKVIGIDIDPNKLTLAREMGALALNAAEQDVVATVTEYTQGRGVDAVVLTLASDSNEPIHQAAQMCRKRGRIVLVGVTGLELSRADFFEKELTFQVSCSYGPGRYDSNYEQKGQDYPLGFVRWTEQRNFSAFLELLETGSVQTKPLLTHKFDVDAAAQAYGVLMAREPALGILLQYPSTVDTEVKTQSPRTIEISGNVGLKKALVKIGFIGSGNYASRILMPAFSRNDCELTAVACRSGVSGVQIAKSLKIPKVTTDNREIFENPDINTVVIATRHDSHAALVCQALEHDKQIFVEKPLVICRAQLEQVDAACRAFVERHGREPLLMVGFNRRFSPHIEKLLPVMRKSTVPKSVVITVNSGQIPLDSWIQDPDVGGGRIIGEGCHFVDLIRFLIGSPIVKVQAYAANQSRQKGVLADIVTLTLIFECGSIGTVHYFSNGSAKFPKERIEVFCDGKIASVDNFRRTLGFTWDGLGTFRTFRQDKGQDACVKQFIEAAKTGSDSPIPLREIFEVAETTLAATEMLTGQ